MVASESLFKKQAAAFLLHYKIFKFNMSIHKRETACHRKEVMRYQQTKNPKFPMNGECKVRQHRCNTHHRCCDIYSDITT